MSGIPTGPDASKGLSTPLLPAKKEEEEKENDSVAPPSPDPSMRPKNERNAKKVNVLVGLILFSSVVAFVVPPVVLFALEFWTVHPPLVARAETSWDWFGALMGYVGYTVVTYIAVAIAQRWRHGMFDNPKRKGFDPNSFIAALYFSYVFGMYASVADRLVVTPWYIVVIFGYFWVYSIMFRASKMSRTDFSCRCSRKNKESSSSLCMNVFKMLVLLVYVTVILCGVFYELWKTHPNETFFFVILAAFLVFSFVSGVLYLAHYQIAHLHHFWLPVIFVSLFSLNSSLFLMMLQAQALAIHLHGISVYGVETLFRTSKYSSKDSSKDSSLDTRPDAPEVTSP